MIQNKNIFTERQICIFGIGGFGRGVYCCLRDIYRKEGRDISNKVVFCEKDELCVEKEIMGCPLIPESSFAPSKYVVFLAMANPEIRQRIDARYPNLVYATIVHPTAVVQAETEIGEDSIVTAGCVINCNVRLGKHAQLNFNTTIGHDCVMGDSFTTAPGVNISGNNTFGDRVYMGTNSCTRQGISICDDVTIGMCSGVLTNLNESGVYIGVPCKKIK